jgi:hypothetical protein
MTSSRTRRVPPCGSSITCTVTCTVAFTVATFLLAAGGCGDGSTCPTTSAAGAGTPAALPVGLAVLSSDYASTSLSLYDPSSLQLHDDCFHTGAVGPGMQDLSGDATLPTEGDPSSRDIVIVDRGNATLDVVTPACALRRQISVSTGFRANPRDVIAIDAHKIYVTRYEANAAPTATPGDFDEGNDVLIVDPTDGVILGRIDLAGEATGAPGVLARPDRGLLLDGRVYVTLGNLSGDFVQAGPGRVVVIDPATDAILGHIDLPEQIGCSGITAVTAAKKLYVACWGDDNAGGDQAATSALVEISVPGAGQALGTLGTVVKAAALGTRPVSFVTTAVLNGVAYVQQVGVLADPQAGTPGSSDVLYAVALATGDLVKVFDGGAYNLGRVAALSENARIYVPDGDTHVPRVHVFELAGGSVTELTAFEPNPAGHLPPREVARY